MDTADSPSSPPPGETAASQARARTFSVVLLGLLVLVAGFTATLVSNSFYPCVPAAGTAVQPPLLDCAVFLSPWLGLALVGLVLALLGYIRLR